MAPNQSIYVVTGEASGDLHAGNLCLELLKIDSTLSIAGVGGQCMSDAGVNIEIDAKDLAVIGLFEILAKYRFIKKILNRIKKRLKQNPPDLLILVDYQEFNQRLAAYAKSIGIKVLFYIGPTVWAWRPRRVYKMAKIVDQLAVIFPFEPAYYERTQLAVEFTGHPLVDSVTIDKSQQEARESLGLDNKTTVGLLPGSRAGEISRLLPIILQSAYLLKQQQPDIQFVLPLANTINQESLSEYLDDLNALNVKVINNKTHDAMLASDALIIASGTATLEAGLLGTPMTILYKISPISYFILNRLVSIQHIGLVNIVSEKEISKEFVQSHAQPKLIADETLKLLTDISYNKSMRSDLLTLRNKLGGGGGYAKTAQLAYNMINA